MEDIQDPEELGRVQVRCYGYHTEIKEYIPTEALLWFSTVVSNSAGVSGKGHSPTEYVQGSFVFGYFLNTDMQDGIVVGSLTGFPVRKDSSKGFSDPDGRFPEYLKESDVNRLSRGDKRHPLYDIKKRQRIKNIPKPFGGTWDEKEYVNGAEYPKNNVYETPESHITEFDDTDGQQRIHQWHRKGTYVEIIDDGTRTVKVIKDNYEIICGDDYIYIDGNVYKTVNGDMLTYVAGDYKIKVDGEFYIDTAHLNATGEVSDGAGTMNEIRFQYNVHTHVDSVGGTTSPPQPTMDTALVDPELSISGEANADDISPADDPDYRIDTTSSGNTDIT